MILIGHPVRENLRVTAITRDWARRESNPSPECQQNAGFSRQAAQNPAHLIADPPPVTPPADPELQRLMDAWPGLPEPIRQAIRALVRVAGGGNPRATE